jgi:hypothetical protein
MDAHKKLKSLLGTISAPAAVLHAEGCEFHITQIKVCSLLEDQKLKVKKRVEVLNSVSHLWCL